ncbi:hypothetical protein [Streptomyces sporangiiformans]|uniref:Lipoprotein n=1 Tax=Streptomyces sporangiiformans TaxID=2315329 RepID=A0A505DKU7_9ACTN|nr:hypothetical protein [Streptomyces sporangiiformans]TPQ20646.1 hypothetical protein FGD71_019685 [Streptomyces sporangiiformans]
MVGSRRGVAVVVVLAAAATGCGTVSERRDEVRGAATAFERALAEGEFGRACAELAPGTAEELEHSVRRPCGKALREESLTPGGAVRLVDVYSNQARAVLTKDTLFLSRFSEGWKVVAAGCRPRSEMPYQCQIKGG